jgi:cytidylate kinase
VDAQEHGPSAPPDFTGVVALDGPSGTGKSTVARRLAERLGCRYLDTGAMYRAATVAVLERGADLSDARAIAATVAGTDISITTDPRRVRVHVDGVPVDDRIRSAEVTAAVSAVSAVAEVRTQLVAQQRALIGSGGIVVEGRDIGAVVWPQARPKVYLTADPAIRARRRAEQEGLANRDGCTNDGSTNDGSTNDGSTNDALAAVASALDRRDRLDSSRAISPLTQAQDATELDTTELGIDDVVDRLLDMTKNHVG